jgi:triacylglycerol lipase
MPKGVEQMVPRLRAPIVLVHGLFGFDRVCMGKLVLAEYFRGVPEALRAVGNRVLLARLSPTAGIAARANQLKRFLDRETPNEPVHLFGHSMGGLDARYAISHLNMAGRVLTLTTLGTPHHGSSFADWAVNRVVPVFQPMLSFLRLPQQAFLDLTTHACAEFNRQTPDAPGVRYFSVAGRYQRHWLNPSWQLTGAIVERAEGPNDGVVSVASARHGEACDVWDAHHMNLVNWPPFGARPRVRDRLPDYAALLRRLADAGF